MRINSSKFLILVLCVWSLSLSIWTWKSQVTDKKKLDPDEEGIVFIKDGFYIEKYTLENNSKMLSAIGQGKILIGVNLLLDAHSSENVDLNSFEEIKMRHLELFKMVELIKSETSGQYSDFDLKRFIVLYDSYIKQ